VAETSYYVYALKDPRSSPAKPFYIGKGTGVRTYEHAKKPDDSVKGERIKAIRKDGYEPLPVTLVDGLSELQALKIEAELISAFGTEATGGLLTNVVVPSGSSRPRTNVVIPQGVQEKAQLGLALLKDAIIELASANKNGVRNADVASCLRLRSDYKGAAKDYLSFSLLGMLMRDNKLQRPKGSAMYVAPSEG
jgi:hypothetical protein